MADDTASGEGQLIDGWGRIEPPRPKVIARATRVIRTHITDPLALEEILDALGIADAS